MKIPGFFFGVKNKKTQPRQFGEIKEILFCF